MNKLKVFIVLVSLFVISLGLKAQVYAGGTLAVLSYDGETFVQVAPEVGYNLNTKWAVAGRIAYNHYSGGNSYLINPYARFTFLQKDLFNLFVDGGVEVYNNEDWSCGGGLTPGIAIKATKHLSFVAKYGFFGYRDNGGSEVYGFSLSSNDLNFGMYYTF